MRNAGTTGSPEQANAVILAALVLIFAAALISPSPLPVGASGLCLVFIVALLWTRDEPPILLLPALFQWSEVATRPLSTLWKQVPLSQLSSDNADLDSAAFYGLAAVAILAAALRLASGRSKRRPFAARLRAEAYRWPFRRVAIVSFSTIGVGYLAAFAYGFAGQASQLVGQFVNVKYVGLFALAYWCLVRRRSLPLLAGLVAFEAVFGMTGFFAEFKNSLLTFLIAAIAARPRFRPADIAPVAAAAAVLLLVGSFWSEVKPSYRNFVNQGSGAQVVLQPLNERLGFLANAAAAMDGSHLAEGFDRLVERHGYIEYLALTMKNVPANVPHENGQLTLAVLRHVSVPRFLSPGKAVLPNDTEVTAHYTGLPLTIEASTSISIGYLGELYVDFGFVGALVAVGVLGGATGLVYRKLRDLRRGPVLLVAGLCLIVVLPWSYFGQAYAKNVGAEIYSWAISFVAVRFWLPRVRIARIRRSSLRRKLLPPVIAATLPHAG